MLKRILLTTFLLVFFQPIYASLESIKLLPNQGELIVNQFQYYVDASREMSFENVSGLVFENYNSQKISVDNVYWLKFEVENGSAYDNDWIFSFPSWGYVDLYSVEEGGKTDRIRSGMLLPYKERPYPNQTRNPVLLQLNSGISKTCFVRVEYLEDKQKFTAPEQLSFRIKLRSDWDRSFSKFNDVIYTFVAIFALIFLINLFVFITTKERDYILYLAILPHVAYLTLNNSGTIHELFNTFEWFPPIQGLIASLVATSLGIIQPLFVLSFLKVKSRYKKTYKYFLIILALSLLPIFFFTVSELLALAAYNLIHVTILVSVIVITIRSVKDKYPSARILLISQSFLVAGTMVILFTLAKVLPQNDFNVSYALPTGYVFEMILFSFVLGNKIKILRSDNEKKQEEILCQLELKQELQTKVSRELKIKVEDRTNEILVQQNKIEHQTDLLKKEKLTSENLLLNILPDFTAQELKQTGKMVPRHHPKATVIYTDFVGFTNIAEKLSAKELVLELDYVFSNFDDIVAKYKLEKIKTIGDSYLCVSGVPDYTDSSIYNAVQAALEMKAFTLKWNAKQENEGKDQWKIRIGIHTGPIISGVVGKNKYSFDIWGDTLLIAGLMERYSLPGEVNISQSTFEKVKELFSFNPNPTEANNELVPNMYLTSELKL